MRYFLTEHRTEGKTWLEHGCIVFSQYYDTAFWIASELAKTLPGEPVGVYAGSGRSGMFRGEAFASVEREEIKIGGQEAQHPPGRRHRCRVRGLESPNPWHAHQRGPAVESIAA